MLRISDPQALPDQWPGSVVAIGKFDGIHLGHRQLIHEAVDYAEDQLLASVVLTFDRHPMALFDPQNCPSEISGPNQKASQISELGVSLLLTLEFDSSLASLSPRQFVEQVLAPLKTRMVFVGEGFTFGSGGLGTISDLRELGREAGFAVREVSNVLITGRKVSSSDIRGLLDNGKVEAAALLLDRNHQVTGEIEHGKKLGRTFGFPTANFSRSSEGYLPQDGVYAGYLHVDGLSYPAAHSVGTNDSVAAVPRLLESHVIGRDDLDLYGKTATAEFVAQVRGWAHFDSLDELLTQIATDVRRASEILGE